MNPKRHGRRIDAIGATKFAAQPFGDDKHEIRLHIRVEIEIWRQNIWRFVDVGKRIFLINELNFRKLGLKRLDAFPVLFKIFRVDVDTVEFAFLRK